MTNEVDKPRCTGTNKKGQPCRATVRRDAETCISHASKEVRESAGFGGAQPGAGRPPNPRAIDLLRERLEARADKVLDVLFDALDATFETEDGRLVDHKTRMIAQREIFDRVYGKAKQATEISGPGGTPVQMTAVDLAGLSRDELRELKVLLEKAAGT